MCCPASTTVRRSRGVGRDGPLDGRRRGHGRVRHPARARRLPDVGRGDERRLWPLVREAVAEREDPDRDSWWRRDRARSAARARRASRGRGSVSAATRCSCCSRRRIRVGPSTSRARAPSCASSTSFPCLRIPSGTWTSSNSRRCSKTRCGPGRTFSSPRPRWTGDSAARPPRVRGGCSSWSSLIASRATPTARVCVRPACRRRRTRWAGGRWHAG